MINVGTINCTSGIIDLMNRSKYFKRMVQGAVGRFVEGDFGYLMGDSGLINQKCLSDGTGQVIGDYWCDVQDGNEEKKVRFWIILNLDENRTVVMFPNEY